MDAQNVESNHSKHSVDELLIKVTELEQRVNEVEQFYSSAEVIKPSTSLVTSSGKDKDNERHVPGIKKIQQDASRREQAASKRMQELMRHFGSILRQITQHKFAWPFMHPVDVEGLGLLDYYEVIDRPMDFSTIKNQMEAKDGTEYKHVRDICADVRLIFQNAMKYNDDKSKVHRMAKTLLAKFEDKWEQFLPKVIEEEKKRQEEEAEVNERLRLAQEAAYARIAGELSNELFQVDSQLEELKETVVKRCRNISIEEKRNLGRALSMLPAEDLNKVLEIVAKNNPHFPIQDEEVELDLDAQNEFTLWRLKFFVNDALGAPANTSSKSGNRKGTKQKDALNPHKSLATKRKGEKSALDANTSKKRNTKPVS